MSVRIASSALLVLFTLGSASLSPPAHAGPWLPAPGEYYSELRGGLFSADSYHNDDGERLSPGGVWEERSIRSITELGWKKNLSFVLSAPFIGIHARDADGTQTATGLEDILLGLRYGVIQGPSALAVELDWQAPLGYSRHGSAFGNPLHGGGLQQLSLSLLYGTSVTSRAFVQVGAGYGYRYLSISRQGGHAAEGEPNEAEDLWSMPFLASADVGVWLTQSILLGGRYSGTMTTSHGDLFPERNVHLAGPMLLFRVDDRLDLMAGTWSTASARNALHYDQFYVALAFKQTGLNRLQGFLGGTSTP
jgi:hypothetical protein